MSTEWLCIIDQEKMCKQAGQDLEIKTIPNVFDEPCIICGKRADCFTVLPKGDPMTSECKEMHVKFIHSKTVFKKTILPKESFCFKFIRLESGLMGLRPNIKKSKTSPFIKLYPRDKETP